MESNSTKLSVVKFAVYNGVGRDLAMWGAGLRRLITNSQPGG
jgi:hypothetical protein